MQIKTIRIQIIVSFALWLLNTGCNNIKAQEPNINSYILIWDYDIDTLNKVLIRNESSEFSFNISYTTLLSLDSKQYPDTTLLILPKTTDSLSNGKSFIELLEIREYLFKHKLYKVYKYYMDDPNMEDEDELYFYTPEIGVFLTASNSWFGYERLVQTKDLTKTQLAFYLSEKIISDKHFFKSWK